MEDLLYYNFRNELDWDKSFIFISNENEYKRSQCSAEDTRDRSYIFKNLIRELPTYVVLFSRKVNTIEDDRCPR